MTTLSLRARRHAEGVETVHKRNARHILELVESYGRSADPRTFVPDADETRLSMDGSQRVHVHSLTNIWARSACWRPALGLVENWSLSPDVRLAVAREPDQRPGLPEDDDPVLRGRSGFDPARLGTLVEACRRR